MSDTQEQAPVQEPVAAAQEPVAAVQEPVAAVQEPVVSVPVEEPVTAVPAEQPLAALPEKDSKKSKSRSLSRKRDSIFNAIRGRKDGEEAKPAQESEATAATDEAKADEAPAPEKPAHEKLAPKIIKRTSIFGNIFGKKEAHTDDSETAPAEAAAATEAAPVDATPPTQPVDVPTPAVSAPSKKEKENFFSKFLGKRAAEKESAVAGDKAEPVDETAPSAASTLAVEPTPLVTDLTTDAPAVASPVTEAEPTTDAAPALPSNSTPASPSDAYKRRTSFFSGLGGKKEKATTSDAEGEAAEARSRTHSKLGGLLRNHSLAGITRGRKPDKDATATPAAVAPAAEPSTETEDAATAVAKTTEEEVVAEPAVAAPTEEVVQPAATGVIGDVVPEAVTVGTTPVVSATA